MKFADKLIQSRIDAGLTQAELAKAISVSLRTITNYETGNRYPKKREVYGKLAQVLNVDVNYLLTENEEFITEATEKYGFRGTAQALEVLEQAKALFAGGDLSEDDQLAFLHEIQGLYLESKEHAKKFTPKRYQK